MDQLITWIYNHSIGWFILRRFKRLFLTGKTKPNETISHNLKYSVKWINKFPWTDKYLGIDFTTYPDLGLKFAGNLFGYGRFDFKVHVQPFINYEGNKLVRWPGIWLLNLSDNKLCEVDVIEFYDTGSCYVSFTNHWNRKSNEYDRKKGWKSNSSGIRNYEVMEKLLESEHTYSIVWCKWIIAWYIDGILVKFTIRGTRHLKMAIVLSNIEWSNVESINYKTF